MNERIHYIKTYAHTSFNIIYFQNVHAPDNEHAR